MEYKPDFCNDGTASADSVYSDWVASNAFDNDEGTTWASGYVPGFPHWIKYDLGAGVTKTARKLRIKPYRPEYGADIKDFKLQGSNNDTDWTDILTATAADSDAWQEWEFANANAYRYYRIYITSSYNATIDLAALYEIELMEATLVVVAPTVTTQAANGIGFD